MRVSLWQMAHDALLITCLLLHRPVPQPIATSCRIQSEQTSYKSRQESRAHLGVVFSEGMHCVHQLLPVLVCYRQGSRLINTSCFQHNSPAQWSHKTSKMNWSIGFNARRLFWDHIPLKVVTVKDPSSNQAATICTYMHRIHMVAMQANTLCRVVDVLMPGATSLANKYVGARVMARVMDSQYA